MVDSCVHYTYPEMVQLLRAAIRLHDSIEDTWITEEFLRMKRLPEFFVQIVVAMTKLPDETLEQYIERLMKNPFAIIVKESDSFSNLQHCIQDGRLKGVKKYTRVLGYLSGVCIIC